MALLRDFARRTGAGGVEGGLLFGAVVGGQRLLVDGVVLLAGGLAFPGLDQTSTETLAVALLLSWGLVVLAPVSWVVATSRE